MERLRSNYPVKFVGVERLVRAAQRADRPVCGFWLIIRNIINLILDQSFLINHYVFWLDNSKISRLTGKLNNFETETDLKISIPNKEDFKKNHSTKGFFRLKMAKILFGFLF